MLKLDGNDNNERIRAKFNTNMSALEAVHTCTGFVAPNFNQDIGVAYNSTTRQVTLTGTFVAFMDGKVVPILKDGWVSPPHANVTGQTYYLRYDGTQFIFNTTPWDYGDIMIASVQFGATHKIALREVHGAGMSPSTHRTLHLNVGTTRVPNGTIFSNYVLNSTTVANRKPYVSAITLLDEDIQDYVSPLTNTTSYCWRYLAGSAVRTLLTAQTEIINLSAGKRPYYNQNVGGTWQQTLFPVNAYGAIFIVAIPATTDAESQAVRYMWVQPQQVSTDFDIIDKLTSNDLVHGDESTLVAEYNFIGKIIIQYKSVDWEIISVEELTGSRVFQVSATNSYSLATSTSDGLMSSVDKARLDDASAVNGFVKSNGSGDFSAGAVATTSVDGLMSAGDKVKVDGLASVSIGITNDIGTRSGAIKAYPALRLGVLHMRFTAGAGVSANTNVKIMHITDSTYYPIQNVGLGTFRTTNTEVKATLNTSGEIVIRVETALVANDTLDIAGVFFY